MSDMSLAGKQVIFIAPKTFGYEVQITKTLEKLGATVFFHSDKPSENKWFKALLRLIPKLMWVYCNSVFNRWLQKEAIKNCDIVFIIKGEGISIDFLESLRERYPTAKFVLYMWDSLRNVKYTKNKLKCFDKAMSFDRQDCKQYPHMKYRSLFYLDTYQAELTSDVHNRLFFLGTLNGDRPKVLASVIEQLNPSIHFDYKLFVRSKIELFLRKLTDHSFSTINHHHLVFKPIPAEEIRQSMATCSAVLDIEHPNQSGLTMRTFEVLATGKKLITTNQSIASESFFDPSRILVIDRFNPQISMDFFRQEIKPMPKSFYNQNSIVGWLSEILDLSETQAA